MAKTLKELRVDQRFSQISLAEACGLTGRTIQRWENAEVSIPTGRLATLARVLKVTVEDVLNAWAEMDSVDAQTLPGA